MNVRSIIDYLNCISLNTKAIHLRFLTMMIVRRFYDNYLIFQLFQLIVNLLLPQPKGKPKFTEVPQHSGKKEVVVEVRKFKPEEVVTLLIS
jgi:hypothetical protein